MAILRLAGFIFGHTVDEKGMLSVVAYPLKVVVVAALWLEIEWAAWVSKMSSLAESLAAMKS